MKRYLLNKLKKINQDLNRKHTAPIQICCINQNEDIITATLITDDGKIDEKYFFKSEKELEQFIMDNNIQNTIRDLCIDNI